MIAGIVLVLICSTASQNPPVNQLPSDELTRFIPPSPQDLQFVVTHVDLNDLNEDRSSDSLLLTETEQPSEVYKSILKNAREESERLLQNSSSSSRSVFEEEEENDDPPRVNSFLTANNSLPLPRICPPHNQKLRKTYNGGKENYENASQDDSSLLNQSLRTPLQPLISLNPLQNVTTPGGLARQNFKTPVSIPPININCTDSTKRVSYYKTLVLDKPFPLIVSQNPILKSALRKSPSNATSNPLTPLHKNISLPFPPFEVSEKIEDIHNIKITPKKTILPDYTIGGLNDHIKKVNISCLQDKINALDKEIEILKIPTDNITHSLEQIRTLEQRKKWLGWIIQIKKDPTFEPPWQGKGEWLNYLAWADEKDKGGKCIMPLYLNRQDSDSLSDLINPNPINLSYSSDRTTDRTTIETMSTFSYDPIDNSGLLTSFQSLCDQAQETELRVNRLHSTIAPSTENLVPLSPKDLIELHSCCHQYLLKFFELFPENPTFELEELVYKNRNDCTMLLKILKKAEEEQKFNSKEDLSMLESLIENEDFLLAGISTKLKIVPLCSVTTSPVPNLPPEDDKTKMVSDCYEMIFSINAFLKQKFISYQDSSSHFSPDSLKSSSLFNPNDDE